MKATRRLAPMAATILLLLVVFDLTSLRAPPAVAAPGGCEFAEALTETGQTEAATRAFVRVLQQDPASECARSGLAELAARPESNRTVCVIADELSAAGADAKAKAALEDAIAKDDPPPCAADKLAALNEEPWWPDLVDLLRDLSRVAASALISGLLIVGVWLVLRHSRAGRWVRQRMGTRVVVGPLTDGGAEPKVAGVLTALMAGEIPRLVGDSPEDMALDVVDSHIELSDALGDLEKVDARFAPATALVRLLERAVRPWRWTLSGQVLTAGAHGPGIVTRLMSGHRQSASATFRTRALPPDTSLTEEHYLPLAITAAGWVRHNAVSEWHVGGATMSTNGESYGWLCAATRAQEQGDLEAALGFYEQAIDADPGHMRARIGWAIVASELAPDPVGQLAILFEALELVEADLGP